MRFKQQLKMETGFGPIVVVPFMNVIFLLCLFYVLCQSFVSQPGLSVKLPRTLTSDIIQEQNLTITITGEDLMYFNNKIVTLKELSNQLSQLHEKNKPLFIKADRRASMGPIVDLWNLCRGLGIENLNIATTQEK